MSLPIRCRCRGLCLTVLVLATCGSPSEARGRAVLSDSIKVDQVGYLPGRPKLAMVADQGATGTFSVRRTGGAEVLSGRLGPAAADPDSGDTVRMADFSGVREAGSFYLDVA